MKISKDFIHAVTFLQPIQPSWLSFSGIIGFNARQLGLVSRVGITNLKSKVSHLRLESFCKLTILAPHFLVLSHLYVPALYILYCTLECRLHEPPLFGELHFLTMVVNYHSYFNGLPLVFLSLYSIAAMHIT